MHWDGGRQAGEAAARPWRTRPLFSRLDGPAILDAVKKWVAIVLIILLPLQTAWAAASVHCTHHEQDAAANHFGHHPDEHGGADAAHVHGPALGDDEGAQTAHTDHHHAGTVGLLPRLLVTVSAAVATQPRRHDAGHPPTSPATRIERPNWCVLA